MAACLWWALQQGLMGRDPRLLRSRPLSRFCPASCAVLCRARPRAAAAGSRGAARAPCLHGRHADATRSAQDEHCLALLQPRSVRQGQVRRAERHGKRSCRLQAFVPRQLLMELH